MAQILENGYVHVSLYTSIDSRIMNNGWVSESFTISRTIRQGFPISALLFIIAAEIMEENIRNNGSIKGIKIGRNREITLSQLADDTTVVFLKTERDKSNLMQELKRFSKASGLILNMLKTQGLWPRSNRRQNDTLHGIDFLETPIKSLGIYFSRNTQECLRLNWDKLLQDIQNLLNSWKRRKLTLCGRITILKT